MDCKIRERRALRSATKRRSYFSLLFLKADISVLFRFDSENPIVLFSRMCSERWDEMEDSERSSGGCVSELAKVEIKASRCVGY